MCVGFGTQGFQTAWITAEGKFEVVEGKKLWGASEKGRSGIRGTR